MDKYITFYESGSLKEVGYTNEFGKQGYWVKYNEEGTKFSEENFSNDKKHGLFIRYNENTTIACISNFVNGFHDGLGVEYYEDGSVLEEWAYENGNFTSINFWNPKGEQTLKNGTGTKIETYHSGLMIEFYYENGNFIKELKLNSVRFEGFTPNENSEE
jgi:antitoxin component YwqK of YwqJK toxin-antitoxin module